MGFSALMLYIQEERRDKYRKLKNPTHAPGCSRGIPTVSASSVLTCAWMAARGHAHRLILLDGDLYSQVRRCSQRSSFVVLPTSDRRVWVHLQLSTLLTLETTIECFFFFYVVYSYNAFEFKLVSISILN